jgi:GNAT superfamily N-acetyltransferase
MTMAATCDELAYDIVLRDGSTVRLRTVRASDGQGLATFLGALSPDTLYLRFFTVPKSSAAEISRLISADGVTSGAIVADCGTRVCGVASWTRDSKRPGHAEVAFLVADHLRGRGLGTRMLEILAADARERGYEAFDAYVLASNDSMMRVFLDSGFQVDCRLDAGVIRVVFPLTEMLIGMSDDAMFGPVVTCAMGGGLTELLRDAAFRLHPLTDVDADNMIEELKGVKLLRGYRGRPPVDEPALKESLLRLSTSLDLGPEIRELDINPLLVQAQGVKALDVRILVEPPRQRSATRRVVY